ncbi:MAG: hypothetical protein ACRD9S_15660 [Pyrinomonadaceae bacterium]
MKLRYSYISAGGYLVLAILYVLTLFVQTGHETNPFDFLFYVNWPICYILDLFPDLIRSESALPHILTCLVAGVFQSALIGFLIDVVVSHYRRG